MCPGFESLIRHQINQEVSDQIAALILKRPLQLACSYAGGGNADHNVRPNVLRGGPRIATNSSARMSKRDGAGLLLPDARASVVLSRAACAYWADRRSAHRVPIAGDWEPCRFNGIVCRRYRCRIGGECIRTARQHWGLGKEGTRHPPSKPCGPRRPGVGHKFPNSGHCMAVVWRTPRCWARKARRVKN